MEWQQIQKRLLEHEVDGHGVRNLNGLTTLLARGPLRHGLDNSHSLLIEVRIERTSYFNVGHGAIGSDDELDIDTTLDAVLLSNDRILNLGGEELTESSFAAREDRHLLYNNEDLVAGFLLLFDLNGLHGAELNLRSIGCLSVLQIEVICNLCVVLYNGESVGNWWWWWWWWWFNFILCCYRNDILLNHSLFCDLLSDSYGVARGPLEGRKGQTKSHSETNLLKEPFLALQVGLG